MFSFVKLPTSNWKSYQNHQTRFGKRRLGILEINVHQNHKIDYATDAVKGDGKRRRGDPERSQAREA